MSGLVLANRMRPARPKASDDYANEILAKRGSREAGESTMSHEAKVEKLALVLSDEQNGIRRLGVGMIGPIQLKLRYQGLTRNVLMEDPVEPGTEHVYDVLDDLGQSYLMHGTDGEVRVTVFEGKRVRVEFFRVASFPAVRKEDLKQLRVNIVEYAQDETKQAILKQEDSRLVTLIQAAQTAYETRPDHLISPSHDVTETNSYITPESLYAAAATVDVHRVPPKHVLINLGRFRDFYRWDINQTGWAFKDRTVAGETIESFGEFDFYKSEILPEDTAYLLPEQRMLGVFPVLYGLDVEEHPNPPAFYKGWVFDEMIAMAILNPRGIASVTLA